MHRYLIALFVCSSILFSQEFRATISGAVTDATGAAIAGAKIVVTETRTNTRAETVIASNGTTPFPSFSPAMRHQLREIPFQIKDANHSVEIHELPLPVTEPRGCGFHAFASMPESQLALSTGVSAAG